MSAPRVYQAISRVAADLARCGVAKSMVNTQEGYQYRSIDELMNRLSPILATRRLCVLPRVLERLTTERTSLQGEALIGVTLKVAFDLVSSHDGSCHTVETFGEALDKSDKATGKALTAAYKSAVLQTFCVPLLGTEDADASSFVWKKAAAPDGGIASSVSEVEPVQGWEQWFADIKDILSSCETVEAVDRCQSINRSLLQSLSRERPDLYGPLGRVFSCRRDRLNSSAPKQEQKLPAQTVTRKASKANGAAPALS